MNKDIDQVDILYGQLIAAAITRTQLDFLSVILKVESYHRRKYDLKLGRMTTGIYEQLIEAFGKTSPDACEILQSRIGQYAHRAEQIEGNVEQIQDHLCKEIQTLLQKWR